MFFACNNIHHEPSTDSIKMEFHILVDLFLLTGK